MGLDITYYRGLTALPSVKTTDDGEVPDYETQWTPGPSMTWSEENWPGRGAPLDARTVYSFAEKASFRAGSYGAYNAWRRRLAAFATSGDFDELINFADNEGVIGSTVAAKLADDFRRNEINIVMASGDDPYFVEKYREWRRAFETAADGGAVDFH